MKKKVVACLLTAAMALGLAACGGSSNTSEKKADSGSGITVSNEYEDKEIDGITYHKAKDMTEENIELTFFHFMDADITQYLCDRFMEIYPNIKVTPSVPTGTDNDYMTSLTSLISNNQSPDVIMYTDADAALKNQYLYDMTELWNSDDETKEMPDTIADQENGFGTFSTGHRYACPAKFYPGIMYADRNVLKALNVDIPDQHWTWDQMIDTIKKCTTTVNGTSYYGLGFYNRLDSYYGIAASQDVIGEFGYNGKTFDLSAWAEGEQQFAELKQNHYVAPSQNSQEMEDWVGDWEAWCGTTGQVALFSEAFWTFQDFWNTEEYKKYNLDIVPYVIPAVNEADASSEHHSIANFFGGGICRGTQHPREAYELMKFLFWGRDGWLTKIQLFQTGASGYENGQLKYPTAETDKPLKNHDMVCPITNNQEVWDAYIKMYCDGMDDEHVQLWKDYFASCMHPISFGWLNIAGYWNACNEYFNGIGIHDLVDSGKAKAADYKDEATKQFNAYHAKAMIDYFGPTGYGILSDDQVAEYQKMYDENSSGGGSTDTQSAN